MNVVHLTASTCYGGPERQMLGLARAMQGDATSRFLSFAEKGRCRPFLSTARHQGFEAVALGHDTPRFGACIQELTEHLDRWQADVLITHGYKADILGQRAARRQGIPIVAVSRGWTGESFKVRMYERLDRLWLRFMDRVVCVSAAQGDRVRRAGVRDSKVEVIVNAVDPERFLDPDPNYQKKLHRYFRQPRTRIIGAAGRLSPEKGFAVLLEAAERVLAVDRSVGFVLFGEGPCRAELTRQISALGLTGSVVLTGFRADFERFLPFFDLFVLPSYTEGMPNVILESFAAGVPVVATEVGGTPELVEDGLSGYLVPPGDPDLLAGRICDALSSEEHLRDMALHGREHVLQNHSFTAQAEQYLALLDELVSPAAAEAPAAAGAETGEAAPGQPGAVAAATAGEAPAAGSPAMQPGAAGGTPASNPTWAA